MSKPLIEYVTGNTPSWAHETIRNWEEVYSRSGAVDMIDFVTREVFEPMSQVNMREVIGQWDHYAGQTWLDAAIDPQYKPSKMRSAFRMYDENPSYYFSGELENGICLSSLNGGPWFSNSGGNHRTVVAKFACERTFEETGIYPHVSGVMKHHYFVDLEALDLFKKLLEFHDHGIHVSVERRQINESRTQGKHLFEYAPAFFVWDSRFGGDARSQWLRAQQFRRFARHVLRQNGQITRLERLQHYWLQFGRSDYESLIYKSQ